ncbi:MAG: [FeFe] hydrogenase, group A [bacterium]|nr:[FeFe] hydrogenase, group A [bacterium]
MQIKKSKISNGVKINLDGKEIICQSGKTIMQVAKENGVIIPGLCRHDDFPAKANCRICVVEISPSTALRTSPSAGSPRPDFVVSAQSNELGTKAGQAAKLVTSCSTEVVDGMIIRTDTARVKKSRNLNIELIFAEHIERCPTCIRRFNCALLELADKYKIEITAFKDRKGKRKIYKFANAVEIDGTQCIDCRNCLDACNNLQKINFLELRGKGIEQEIVPATEGNGFPFIGKRRKKVDCIYCGQCSLYCPVTAAQEQAHWQLVEKDLKNKSKVLVAQFAPSIRVSIGEGFGVPGGKVMTGQVVAALKELGFNYVFDVNFGADITTIVEAEELLARVKSGQGGPMFTSCCPAWIKYVEFFRPDLIPNLTTARSPQIHSAGIIKTYWAEKLKINPKNIVVVSIMPCTAKKFEAGRKELKISGHYPIDYVITTRELIWLIKKNKINFAGLEPLPADNPLGLASGAAAIYGASGGVMESALRTAEYLMQTAQDAVCRDLDKEGKPRVKFCDSKIEFKAVRGLAGVRRAELAMGDKKLRVAVVNGIGNVKPVLDNLKDYDYIEVMACPDGCIGGGGQPIPTTAAIRKTRLAALYKIDGSSKIRRAHENSQAVEVLSWLKNKGKLENKVLLTKYKKRS